MLVRRAESRDVAPIATLHADGDALTVYSAPGDTELRATLLSEKTDLWRFLLPEPPGGQQVLVAERAGRVVAFASAGPEATGGKLYALFVREDTWGHGVGALLLDAAERHLVSLGLDGHLWVVETNSRARSFYERRGWAPDGAEKAQRGAMFMRYVKHLNAR